MKVLLLLLPGVLGLTFLAVLLTDGLRMVFARQRPAPRLPMPLMVSARTDFTEDLFSVTLISPVGKRLPRYQAGQYLTVEIDNSGDRVRRRYSLAGWEPSPRHYELTIRRLSAGLVSNALYRQLQPGATLMALPASGDFVPTRRSSLSVLIAGGVGITSLRAMLHWFLRNRRHRGRGVVLFHAARHEAELCYQAEFRVLADEHPAFRYYPILSQAEPSWQGMRGRLDADAILGSLADTHAAEFYLCAGASMTEALRQGLLCHGVPAHSIRRELFGAFVHTNTGHHQIRIGERNFVFDGQPTLLHAMEQAGIRIESDCRNGHCGACRVKWHAGHFEWLLDAEARADLACNELLACCVVPSGNLSLSL